MSFNDKTYDVLKWIAQYLLPALGTLYFALASIWGLPYGEQVVGTVTAVDTFLGVLLGISSSNYSGDGTLNIDTGAEGKNNFEFSQPLENFAGKKSVTFKVNTTNSTPEK